jgi:hypothetical protein
LNFLIFQQSVLHSRRAIEISSYKNRAARSGVGFHLGLPGFFHINVHLNPDDLARAGMCGRIQKLRICECNRKRDEKKLKRRKPSPIKEKPRLREMLKQWMYSFQAPSGVMKLTKGDALGNAMKNFIKRKIS